MPSWLARVVLPSWISPLHQVHEATDHPLTYWMPPPLWGSSRQTNYSLLSVMAYTSRVSLFLTLISHIISQTDDSRLFLAPVQWCSTVLHLTHSRTRQAQAVWVGKEDNRGPQSTKCSANTRKEISIVFLATISACTDSVTSLSCQTGVWPHPKARNLSLGEGGEGHCSTQRPNHPGHGVSTRCLPSDSLWRAERSSLQDQGGGTEKGGMRQVPRPLL